MSSNTILIIANGEAPPKKILNRLTESASCIIAADGGCNACAQNGLEPDYAIGDLDSMDPETCQRFKATEFIHVGDQETTDVQKALNLARDMQANRIVLTGVTGLRSDHMLGNMLLLQNWRHETPLEIVDAFGSFSIVINETDLHLPVGRLVSLLSFTPAFGITLTGFKYPLQNADFPDGFPGISNEISADPARIQLREGKLFMYVSHE